MRVLTLLLIDEDADLRRWCAETYGADHCICAPTATSGENLAREHRPDVVLLAGNLDDWTAIHSVAEFVATGAQVIVLAPELNETRALYALDAGAFAYLERTDREGIAEHVGDAARERQPLLTAVAS